MQYDETFRAMGTDVDVVIESGSGSAPIDAFLSLRLLFERQEALFSRFRPTSLLSRLNARQAVEQPTFAAACRLALEAHEFTGGVFNPMVLPALMDAGYVGTFERLARGHPRAQLIPDANECIVIDGDTVRLRTGGLDLGGIVKGWTVDLAIAMLRDRFDGALVNAGGDLRSIGSEEHGRGWAMEVDSPKGGTAWAGTVDGALATSTTLVRRWQTSTGGEAHHLINPLTGLPASNPVVQVSVWGSEAWRAECWAKAILIAGETRAEQAKAAGYEVLALDADGRAVFGR